MILIMKQLLIFTVFFFHLFAAEAACHSVFNFGMFASIMIQNPDGGFPDGDADLLWKSMNVPEQDSNLGPGKSIVSAGKEINFICVNRGGDGKQMTCTLTFNSRGPNASRWLKMDSSARTIHVLVQGAEASFFTEKFHLPSDNGGPLLFRSNDQKFALVVQAGRFEIFYDEKGLTQP